jgi:hypothetical protein
VSGLYEAPFRFGGTTRRTEIDLAPETLGAVDIEEPKKADTCASRSEMTVDRHHEAGSSATARGLWSRGPAPWLASSVPVAVP